MMLQGAALVPVVGMLGRLDRGRGGGGPTSSRMMLQGAALVPVVDRGRRGGRSAARQRRP